MVCKKFAQTAEAKETRGSFSSEVVENSSNQPLPDEGTGREKGKKRREELGGVAGSGPPPDRPKVKSDQRRGGRSGGKK